MPTIDDMPDAVSDVLELVGMRGEFVCESEASEPWSVRLDRPGAHLHIVRSGSAWLKLDGDDAAIRLSAGEFVVLPHRGAHVLSSDPSLRPIALEAAIAEDAKRDNLVFHMGGAGAETRLICARFDFTGVLASNLLSALPTLIHVRAGAGQAPGWLGATSDLLSSELRDPRPGGAITIARLLDVLFAQAVRAWGATGPGELGWLSGLRDAQIGRTLSAIHEEPAKEWTVEDLARIAALSRSAFAVRFSKVVGTTPQRYLATWRLDLAADHLRAGTARIADIARTVGYGSEAALTRAFKNRFGETPAAFRAQRGAQALR